MIQLIVGSKAFHSTFLKINIRSLRGEIYLLFRQNIDFKRYLDAEMSQEEEETTSLLETSKNTFFLSKRGYK